MSGNDISRGHAGHFINGRDPHVDFAPAVLPQRDHAFLERLVADDHRVDALHTELADRLTRDHQLVDAAPAAEPALTTGAAARALPQLEPRSPLGEVRR